MLNYKKSQFRRLIKTRTASVLQSTGHTFLRLDVEAVKTLLLVQQTVHSVSRKSAVAFLAPA